MAKSCNICPHNCQGDVGICGVQEKGLISSIAVDPIEKKPLYHFHPGRPILSIGGFGCNLRCQFCQNHHISMIQGRGQKLSPQEILSMVKEIPNNIGIAYTYNEPLINYDFVLDCAQLIHNAAYCNVLITNGYINRKPLEALLPYVDAMNIDLKGFTEEFYNKLGGSLQPVLDSISLAHKHCHIEVTTLVIPEENESHIEPIAQWLAALDDSIPLHISRFFPRYQYEGKEATPPETIYHLCDIAKKYLKNVHPGNVH